MRILVMLGEILYYVKDFKRVDGLLGVVCCIVGVFVGRYVVVNNFCNF